MRYFTIAVFALIIFSLGSALVYMVKDRGSGERMVRALTWRVGLSVGLFIVLMTAHYFGFISGRG